MNNYYKPFTIILLALLFCYVIYSMCAVNFMEGGLGRLLAEGKLVVNDFEIIKTNYFSFTNPDFPIENYHWLSAALLFLIHQVVGFSGLHIFSILLLLIVFFQYYNCLLKQKDKHHILWTWLMFMCSIPVIIHHSSITHLVFSIAFFVCFLIVSIRFLQQKNTVRSLGMLVILQLCWVNMHSSYYWGWLIILATLIQILFSNIDSSIKSPLVKQTIVVLGASLLISILNPQGWAVWLSPFNRILTSYASLPLDVENVLQRIGHFDEALDVTPIYIIALSLALMIGIFLVIKEKITKIPIFYWSIITIGAIVTSFWSIYNVPFLALTAISFLTTVGDYYLKQKGTQYFWTNYQSPFLIWIFLLFPVFFWIESERFLNPLTPTIGLGLDKNELDAVAFIQQTGIKGPFFTNRAAAGKFIYQLSPQYKTYIDDRYNAQPNNFLEKEYFPNLSEDNLTNWHQLKNKYPINAIYFNLEAETNKKLLFLGNRLSDGEWALVYQNKNKDAVLLRQIKENQEIIQKYQIDPSIE